MEIGEEYVTALSFDPTMLRLAMPEPSTGLLMGLGLALFGLWRCAAEPVASSATRRSRSAGT